MILSQSSRELLNIPDILEEIFGESLHKKRQLSLGYAALGILSSQSLFLHHMGEGLAEARGLSKKHATKQIDRLLSNKGVDIWEIAAYWIPYIIEEQTNILTSLDWTSFADDEQTTISLNIVTKAGCSVPLLWKTVENKRLKYNRARYEDQLLSRFKEVLPQGVQVTLLADRGFADQKFFHFLSEALAFDYIVRIKSNTLIKSQAGESRKASAWLKKDGHISRLVSPTITAQNYPVKQTVFIQDKGMKSAWFLVSNIPDKTAREIVNLYAKRWKIEPYFRDLKDSRFGYALQETHLRHDRRDRLLFLVALCYVLINLLGSVGEKLGLDKLLKVNTVKTRTHSLFRQGQFYYEFFHRLKPEQQKDLTLAFSEQLQTIKFWNTFFDEHLK